MTTELKSQGIEMNIDCIHAYCMYKHQTANQRIDSWKIIVHKCGEYIGKPSNPDIQLPYVALIANNPRKPELFEFAQSVYKQLGKSAVTGTATSMNMCKKVIPGGAKNM